MKCIHCNQDAKFKDRANRVCPSCSHPFAFEPQQGDPFTDGAMKGAIDAVSSGGVVRFGVEHVYYEVCRRLYRKARRRSWIGASSIAAIGGFFTLAAAPMVAPLWAGAFLWPLLRSGLVPLDSRDFAGLWKRYTVAHGVPSGAIVRKPDTDGPYRGHHEPEPDLGDYSFDRAVVCDRARTVDLLLANNFHFENSCAVLSVDGYPKRVFKTVHAMLLRNQRLQVFALHDATWSGCTMARWLRTDASWFGGPQSRGVTISDIGLRPRQVRRMRGLFRPGETAEPAVKATLSSRDQKWLHRYTVELAAVRPEQALKAVFRAMNAPRSSDSDAGEISYWDSGSSGGDGGGWGDDASGGDDGGADGFG